MSVLLLASACPVPVVPTGFVRLADADTNMGTGIPTSSGVTSGDTVWSNKFNRNACAQDLTARHGSGAYAVAHGLTLTAPGSGLLLNVSAGQAMIDGPVEVPSNTTVAVNDNTARVWIWLLQNGTLTQVPTSLTPPSAACVLLGSCTTSGGNIGAVDTSGVVQMQMGVPTRATADNGMPTDAPSSTAAFIHQSALSRYWWDGTHYHAIGDLAGTSKNIMASGDKAFVGAGYQRQYFGHLTVGVGARLMVAGHVRVAG